MIRLGCSIDPHSTHKLWTDHIAQHVASSGSERASTCRRIGLNPRAMYEWFERGSSVGLESVLTVCVHLGISMDVVFDEATAEQTVSLSLAAPSTLKASRRRHDSGTRVRAKAALDSAIAEVAPPNLRVVAHGLDVSTGFLRYWFPQEVAALRAVHQRLEVQARELRQLRDAALIESTVKTMVQAGSYPGRKRVEAALRAAGASLLSPANLAIYKTALVSNVKR